jgi:hydrogenase nickel incorporation protein HypA/HybF
MHEMSLLADLMRKIEAVAREQGAERVVSVTVRLGALAHISPGHLREHFVQAARETIADGADFHVIEISDEHHPEAQDIILDSVEVE